MTDVYPILKGLHVTCVCLALAGLLLRTWWRHNDSPLLRHPATRTLPHANDTLLLAAGAGMALLLQQYPFQQPWLTAKLLAVCAYVVFGSLAVKLAPTPRLQHLSLIGALIAFAFIVSVAVTQDPWPFY